MKSTREAGRLCLALGIGTWAIPMLLDVCIACTLALTNLAPNALARPIIVAGWVSPFLAVVAVIVGSQGWKVSKMAGERLSYALIVGLTLGLVAIINTIWHLAFGSITVSVLNSAIQRGH
jgi:hypothetical protein